MSKAWLYKQEVIEGKVFELGEDGKRGEIYAQLKKDGWLDSPASLKKPKPEPVEISKERADSMSPDDMASQVKGYGYHVFTEIELQAKLNKHLLEVSDNALCAEIDKRGLKRTDESADELNDLQDRFIADPKSLIKEEHIVLGKALGVKLRINFGEQTMIDKIQAKLDEA